MPICTIQPYGAHVVHSKSAHIVRLKKRVQFLLQSNGIACRHSENSECHGKRPTSVIFLTLFSTDLFTENRLRLSLRHLRSGYARSYGPTLQAPLFPGLRRPRTRLLTRRTQGDTKAQEVVPVRRDEPVTERGPAIPGGVVPAPAPVHPVRAFRPPPPNVLTPFDGNSNWPVHPLE